MNPFSRTSGRTADDIVKCPKHAVGYWKGEQCFICVHTLEKVGKKKKTNHKNP